MKLNNYTQCDKCRKIYDTSPFACMIGNGERADCTVEIYGDKYNLCPRCTNELYGSLQRNNQ